MKKEQRRNKPCKILIASQDPGGTNAVWPVVKELLKNSNFKFKVKFFVGSYGQMLCIREKKSCLNAEKFSFKKLNFEFKNFNPDLVFTSTSRGFSVEKKIIRLAKKNNVPTVSIIDYWSNYWLRFVCEKEKKSVGYLPDRIIAVDALMKKQMLKEGFPNSHIEIVGNPYFETFVQGCKSKKVSKKRLSILFVSQPLRRVCKENKNLKYDEHLVLNDILDILKEINKKNWFLTIRLHPLEEAHKYDILIKLNEKKVNIKIDNFSSIKELIKKADLVLGMNSMVLFQSSMAGVPTISYQPRLEKKYDTLISNILKLSILSCSKNDLKNKIVSFAGKTNKMDELRSSKKPVNKYIKSDATKKIINLILKMMSSK